jgi:integrative and conjugative element protein (TIGR02256 family)
MGEVWIAQAVLAGMTQEAERKTPTETGGVLLGYFADGATVATDWVGPGPNAVHADHGFIPDYEYQEEQIAIRYEESGRRLIYLGDWHTHPTGSADLSKKDEACLRRIAGSRSARIVNPVMVVLTEAPQWTLAAWRCEHGRSILRRGVIRTAAVRMW